jgi:hypothetical protein
LWKRKDFVEEVFCIIIDKLLLVDTEGIAFYEVLMFIINSLDEERLVKLLHLIKSRD